MCSQLFSVLGFLQKVFFIKFCVLSCSQFSVFCEKFFVRSVFSVVLSSQFFVKSFFIKFCVLSCSQFRGFLRSEPSGLGTKKGDCKKIPTFENDDTRSTMSEHAKDTAIEITPKPQASSVRVPRIVAEINRVASRVRDRNKREEEDTNKAEQRKKDDKKRKNNVIDKQKNKDRMKKKREEEDTDKSEKRKNHDKERKRNEKVKTRVHFKLIAVAVNQDDFREENIPKDLFDCSVGSLYDKKNQCEHCKAYRFENERNFTSKSFNSSFKAESSFTIL